MDLKMHVYSVPLLSPASLRILRWGNASDQKLEVWELCSPASYYTLTTDVVIIVVKLLYAVLVVIRLFI